MHGRHEAGIPPPKARLGALPGYYGGPRSAGIAYTGSEIAIFIVEANLFAWWTGRHDPQKRPRSRAVLCAVVANAASLLAGLII